MPRRGTYCVWREAASLPKIPAKGLLLRFLRKRITFPCTLTVCRGCLSMPTSDLDLGVTAWQTARKWALGELQLAVAAWRGKPEHEGTRVSERGTTRPYSSSGRTTSEVPGMKKGLVYVNEWKASGSRCSIIFLSAGENSSRALRNTGSKFSA